MSRAQREIDAYRRAMGDAATERQLRAADALRPCCGEPKASPHAPDGLSAHVLDSLNAWRVVAVYRSETREGFGADQHTIGPTAALRRAERHAARLNRAEHGQS